MKEGEDMGGKRGGGFLVGFLGGFLVSLGEK